MIPLFWPTFDKTTILDELSDTLSGRWLGQGEKVEEFERQFCETFGYTNALFLNSATAGLELAYHLLGLKKGDQVIVPVLNCTAGQMGLVRRGVRPVFADIDDNFNISLEDIKRKVTRKTKAIVVVHLGGIPVNYEIYDWARKKGIAVITDSAQHLAHSEGDFVVYSFQAIKHLTTGDGGMLVCNNIEDHVRAKKLRWFGIDRDLKKKHGWQAWERREMTFDIEEAGYKFQPTDIDACFGLSGLKTFQYGIDHRKRLVELYRVGLHDCPVRVIAGGTCWLIGIVCPTRDKLADFLKEQDVETNLVHLRNDIFKVFKPYRSSCPNMDFFEACYLYLPLNPQVTEEDVQFICSKINNFYKI